MDIDEENNKHIIGEEFQELVDESTSLSKQLFASLSSVEEFLAKNADETHPLETNAEFLNLLDHCSLLFLDLKETHRDLHIKSKVFKKKAEEKRVLLDDRHLVLQNLLYEKQRLLNEIESCKEFTTRPLGVDLISVEEFESTASQNLLQSSNDHQLMSNRLAHEKLQRILLSQQLVDLDNAKKEIETVITSREKIYQSLNEKLENVLKECTSIQQSFGESHTNTTNSKLDESAHLPICLYGFLRNIIAYRDTFDPSLKVEIVGDAEKAILFNETGVHEKEPQMKKHCPKSKIASEKNNLRKEKQNWLLQEHPLTIHLTIPDHTDKNGNSLEESNKHSARSSSASSSNALCLVFKYIVRLGIVCVQAKQSATAEQKGKHFKTSSYTTEDVNILNCLYDETDIGTVSPNPKNMYQLDSVEIDSFDTVIERCGRPFQWAQVSCGLSHNLSSVSNNVLLTCDDDNDNNTSEEMEVDGTSPSKSSHDKKSNHSSNNASARSYSDRQLRQHLSQTIQLIQHRIISNKRLNNELLCLKKNKIDLSHVDPDFVDKIFPVSPNVSLTSWLSQEEKFDYQVFSFTIAKPKSSLEMKGTVKISPMYPLVPPEFKLNFSPVFAEPIATEVVEKEVNLYYGELMNGTGDYLLSMQMRRLELICEYYVQLTKATSSSSNVLGRLCSRLSRGPLHEPPTAIDPESLMILTREG